MNMKTITTFTCLLCTVSALPSGVYFADYTGNQFYNPTHEPHTHVNLSIDISTNSGEQTAVSTGSIAYFIGGWLGMNNVSVITISHNDTLIAPSLIMGRFAHAVAVYKSGIVVCGGQDSNLAYLDSCERLSLNSSGLWMDDWQEFATLPAAFSRACLMTVNDTVGLLLKARRLEHLS